MPLGINFAGEVLDFYYKKMNTGVYAFYLHGRNVPKIYIGQMHKLGSGWTAIPAEKRENRFCFSVDGFQDRYAASTYLLNYMGYLDEKR